jgi:hypothetical protein
MNIFFVDPKTGRPEEATSASLMNHFLKRGFSEEQVREALGIIQKQSQQSRLEILQLVRHRQVQLTHK